MSTATEPDNLPDSFGFHPTTLGEAAQAAPAEASTPPARPVRFYWTPPDGRQREARLTSSRWALHAAVLAEIMPSIHTADIPKALTVHTHRRYLSATLLLWFCLHDPEAWEEPRGDHPPLVTDWHALAREARRWADQNIPAGKLDAAVTLAEALAAATFGNPTATITNSD